MTSTRFDTTEWLTLFFSSGLPCEVCPIPRCMRGLLSHHWRVDCEFVLASAKHLCEDFDSALFGGGYSIVFILAFHSSHFALHPTSIAANALMTSSATPPCSTTILVTWDIKFLFMPPLGGVHTPEAASNSRCVRASALDVGATPPVAEFIEFGMPGGVRWDGGSIVRIETMRAPVVDEDVFVHAIARTASATASSSLHGSKMMFGPTAMARIMTGGLSVVVLSAFLGNRDTAASQSSLNSGSSSCSDLRAGSSVVRSARWVVMERRASG
jgi:hypothetical protein